MKRASTENGQDAVIEADKDGTIRSLNALAEVLTGWSEREARGRALNEIFRTGPSARSSTREGSVLRSRDGSLVLIQGGAAAVEDSDGQRGVLLHFSRRSHRPVPMPKPWRPRTKNPRGDDAA